MDWFWQWRERQQMRRWVAECARRRAFLDQLAADVEAEDPARAADIRRLSVWQIIEPELNPDNPPRWP